MKRDHPADEDSRPYRPCVGIVLLDRRGLVFVGRRARGQGVEDAWQMPQGGIDPGESALEAARRELREETNVTSAAFLAETPGWYRYDLPQGTAPGWRGRYRGQKQKWFAFRFTGPESEIDVLNPAGHKAEFDAWRWEDMNRLPDLIVAFKRPVYERVVTDFAHLAGASDAL